MLTPSPGRIVRAWLILTVIVAAARQVSCGQGILNSIAPATQAIDANPSVVGSLVGRVLYNGPPPQPRIINLSLANQRDSEGRKGVVEDADRLRQLGIVDESLIVGPVGGIANVFVWLRSKDVPVVPSSGPLPATTMRIKDGRFDPHAVALRRGGSLRFVNEASHGINVNLDGAANVVLPPGAAHELTELRAAAVPIQVTSGIHTWLAAFVLPLEHDYFSVTGLDGRFEIKNLPLGEWEFAIWHEKPGWLKTDRFPISRFPAGRFKVYIAPGENDLGGLRVDPIVFTRTEPPAPQPIADPIVAEVARQAADLRQLLAELRQALPTGWRADFSSDILWTNEYVWMSRSAGTCLVIYLEKETPGFHLGPGMPIHAGDGKPWLPYEPLRVWMSLTLDPYLTPEQYHTTLAENQDKERRRIDFERRLVGIQYGHKGPDPKPASAFRPQTPEQAELVREYALYLLRTEPMPLPTHHYRTLAMTIQVPHLELQDKVVQQQLEQIEQRLLTTVSSYEASSAQR